MPKASDLLPTTPAHSRAVAIITSATVLALLYFGREVLVPITLALILSLLIAPLVGVLRRIGLGHGPSVLIAVLALVMFLVGLATLIGTQVVHVGTNLPQYEQTVRIKLQTLSSLTAGRIEAVQGEATKVLSQLSDHSADQQTTPNDALRNPAAVNGVVPVEIRAAAPGAMTVITRIFSSIWPPLQTAGIVLVVLIFVLLEHESLRDRFIRLAGGSDLRATTAAINDAGERLSRFFVSQFAVNFGVGAVVWLGLIIIGVPNAPLWATLTAVLRFVPYVGVWLAAIPAMLLAAAVDPGWSPTLLTMGLYIVVETTAGQLVEPQLYGHTTGLSPLAVVVAAIFWSWLWGPIGLIMSTPLTLCLVVAGRHVKALNLLDILLGDLPALTMPQRFYQRALSGDSDEIIASARVFLKRKSFAAYCDSVLLPALQLTRIDLTSGAINREQQIIVRGAIVRVIESLGSHARKQSRWHRRVSVLDGASLGQLLRQQRESVSGRWQGPLVVAPGSVVLCTGLGATGDDLATEILARILRDLNIDARHLSIEDIEAIEADPPPEVTVGGISMVYIVSASSNNERASSASVAGEMRRRFPDACILAVFLPELLAMPEVMPVDPNVNQVVTSLEEAAQQAIARFPGSAKIGEG